ncbi:hypothetical protein [Micromonospora profundi]|uniref:hypothetical protein n=1 Tax=Micromonospora profundi TaxID=1420889 RepID=UPI003811F520
MSGPETPHDGAPRTLAWLCHPTTLLALVVLVVNDHVLKPALPGLVTGKLSDVAGLVLAPPLVAVLLTLVVPRMSARSAALVGLVSVGAGFAVVKSSGYAAELASSVWTVLAGASLVRADPTDLLAVPALGLAWWSWTRSRRRPVRQRTARLVRLLVVLPPAVLAVAATSAVHYPYAISTAFVDGHPAVSVGSGTDLTPWPTSATDGRWSVSDDLGATWQEADLDEQRRLSSQSAGQRQACVPADPRRCYRAVAGHLRVEQSDDGGTTWHVAWEVSDAQREDLARRSWSPGDVDRHFASRDLIVYPAGSGGHEVLVANGRDGFVHRWSDGGWRRVGFLGDAYLGARGAPPELGSGGPARRQLDLLLAVALALTLGSMVTVLAGHLAILRGRGPGWWGFTGGLSVLLSGTLLAVVWGRDDDTDTFMALLFIIVPMGFLAATALLVRPRYQGATPRWTRRTLSTFLLTVLLAGLPLIGWLYGTPARTRSAVTLALLAAIPGLWLAVRNARLVDAPRAYERRHPVRPPTVPDPSYPAGLPPR